LGILPKNKGGYMTVLKIERLPHNKILPEYKTDGAAGMDLCAAIDEPVELKPLERRLIPTGLKIELEHGYEAQIRPRSGMSIKHGITLINCVGTIDEDYRGEVCVAVVNVSNEAYTIEPQERIAQMVITKYEQAKIDVVTELSETVRGAGGFGSTGK
jgi:dUTP pyrophosphatase